MVSDRVMLGSKFFTSKEINFALSATVIILILLIKSNEFEMLTLTVKIQMFQITKTSDIETVVTKLLFSCGNIAVSYLSSDMNLHQVRSQ